MPGKRTPGVALHLPEAFLHVKGGLFGPVISSFTPCSAWPPGEESFLLPRMA